MALFTNSQFIRDLSEHRLWSLSWVQDNGIKGPFTYVILRKREGGGYDQHGEFPTANEAFEARRQLVTERGDAKFFLRCRRVLPVVDDSGEDLDCFRDALRTGDHTWVPANQLAEFKAWASKTVSSRAAYRGSSPYNHF